MQPKASMLSRNLRMWFVWLHAVRLVPAPSDLLHLALQQPRIIWLLPFHWNKRAGSVSSKRNIWDKGMSLHTTKTLWCLGGEKGRANLSQYQHTDPMGHKGGAPRSHFRTQPDPLQKAFVLHELSFQQTEAQLPWFSTEVLQRNQRRWNAALHVCSLYSLTTEWWVPILKKYWLKYIVTYSEDGGGFFLANNNSAAINSVLKRRLFLVYR